MVIFADDPNLTTDLVQNDSGDGPVGVLGGTFDPVHLGHLRLALEVVDRAQLDHVRLVPCRQPVHRPPPRATVVQRVEWLQQAIAVEPLLRLDLCEVERETPSYMVETLLQIDRHFQGQRPLCLIVGMDAFSGLMNWYRWRALFQYAHLIVVHRPGHPLPSTPEITELLQQRRSEDPHDLCRLPANESGRILLLQVPALEISSSAIRQMIAAGQPPRFLLPATIYDSVIEYYASLQKG